MQAVIGRGTLSELLFSSAMLAPQRVAHLLAGGRAQRARSSLGLVGAMFFVLPRPALLQLPEVPRPTLAAIPLLWRFADAPGARPRLWLAVVTVVAFLFRHDHGVFIAASMAALLVLLRDMSVDASG